MATIAIPEPVVYPEDIHALRAERGCSVREAQELALLQARRDSINCCTDIDDIKRYLLWQVEYDERKMRGFG